MTSNITQQLIELVRNLGGYGVFLGVMLETFIAPIPSALVPMAAGFILIPSKSTISEAILRCFYTIGLIGAISSTLGSFFGYSIGYIGGKPLIDKWGRALGVTWREIEKVNKIFIAESKGKLLFFVSRLTPIIPLSPLSIGAGLIRMDIRQFTLITFMGTLPRYFILGLIGWTLGVTYEKVSQSIEIAEILTLILIIAFIIYIIYKLRGSK